MGRFNDKSQNWKIEEKLLFGNFLEMSAWAKTLTEEEKVADTLLRDEEKREVQGIKSHFNSVLDTDKDVDAEKFFSFVENLEKEEVKNTRKYTHKLNDRMLELTNNIRDRKFGLDLNPTELDIDIEPSEFGLTYSEAEEIVENYTGPIVSSLDNIEEKVDRNYEAVQNIGFGDISVELTDEDLNYIAENVAVDTGYDEVLELINNRFDDHHGDVLEAVNQYQNQLTRIEDGVEEANRKLDMLIEDDGSDTPEATPEPDYPDPEPRRRRRNRRDDTYGRGFANKADGEEKTRRGFIRDGAIALGALAGVLGTGAAVDTLSDGELDGNLSEDAQNGQNYAEPEIHNFRIDGQLIDEVTSDYNDRELRSLGLYAEHEEYFDQDGNKDLVAAEVWYAESTDPNDSEIQFTYENNGEKVTSNIGQIPDTFAEDLYEANTQ